MHSGSPVKNDPGLRKRRATMREVAERADVAVSTVSAYLNGSARVSGASARRIQRAIEELRYQPDELARSLKTGKSRVIGVIVPDLTNPFYPEVVRGIEAAAREARYAVLLSETGEDLATETCAWNLLRSRRVDGVLIACSDSTASYAHMKGARPPVVFFDRLPLHDEFPTITTAHALGAETATRYLIGLGHRRIAAILGDLRLSTHQGRWQGFQKAMRDAGLSIRQDLVRTGQQEIENGYQFGQELLARSPRPTAVFCGNNKMLLGVYRALQDAGVRVPREISLVGFDRNAWTEHASPPITTIAQQTERLGREGFRLLLEQIEGRARANAHVEMEAEFCLRGSTAAPPKKGSRDT